MKNNIKSLPFINLPIFYLCLVANVFLSFTDNILHPFLFLIFCFLAFIFSLSFGNNLKQYNNLYLKGYLIDLIAGSIMIFYWKYTYGNPYPDLGYSDVLAYIKLSATPFPEYWKHPFFNDPGFYTINRLIWLLSHLFSQDTSLVHLQILWCAGGLLRCYILMVMKHILKKEVPLQWQLLILFYPKIIHYSSGILIRDSIIVLFTATVAYNYCNFLNKEKQIKSLLRLTTAIILVYFFRSNVPYLLLAAIGFERIINIMLLQKKVENKIFLIIVSIIIFYFGSSVWRNTHSSLLVSSKNYADVLSQYLQGEPTLGTSFMKAVGPIGIIIKTSYNFIVPLPFYSSFYLNGIWKLTPIFLGLGALVWQLLIGYWLLGAIEIIKLKEKTQLFLFIGAFIFLVAVAIIMPSNRYTYAGEVFLWGPIVSSIPYKSNNRIKLNLGIWLTTALYSIYFILKYLFPFNI